MHEFTNKTTRSGAWKLWGGAAAAAALLAACGGGAGGGETGTLRVALTDAPACGYDHVWVTVEKVRVHTSGSANDNDAGWRDVALSKPERIDLLSLTNGALQELGQAPLPAGAYSQVRLVLADNSGDPLAHAIQPTGGAVQALATPSSMQSGLKLKANFTVEANQLADLVLDFDACRSIVKRGNSGQFNLKPVVSVFKRLTAGIEGYVSTALPLASTTVSVQQNGATVRATVPDSSGKFLVPYLNDGAYNVVITSEGFSTAVVTSVPVSLTTGKTVLNDAAHAFSTPSSTMKEVKGAVTPAAEASVRALQALSGGPTVELADVPVDADLGTYKVRLPIAAPQKAAYSNTGSYSFTADTAAAGKVTLQAVAPGRTPVNSAVLDLATQSAAVNFNFAP
ncbi:MAG TPA: DUF4382 domain-containing protein [Ramlibacter sp.]|nr:DUF4382 domain-containing protein [Ramlibacter sp.]